MCNFSVEKEGRLSNSAKSILCNHIFLLQKIGEFLRILGFHFRFFRFAFSVKKEVRVGSRVGNTRVGMSVITDFRVGNRTLLCSRIRDDAS